MGDNPGVHKIELHQPKKAFAIIPNRAVRDARITANSFRLLAYLLSHNDGYELTYRQIEKETGLGRYAINAASKQLGELGWLRVEQTKLKNGQFGPKSWTLLTPDGNESTAGEPVAGQSAPDSFRSGTANGLKKTTSRENKQLEKTTVENTRDIDEQFDRFWKVYPKKDDKPLARRSFEKALKRATIDVIVAGAERYRDDPNRELGFTKNGSTWLNADAWNNGPLPPRKQKRANWEDAADLARKYREAEQPAIEYENETIANEIASDAVSWLKGVDDD
jgi:predicted transcriptional regulator